MMWIVLFFLGFLKSAQACSERPSFSIISFHGDPSGSFERIGDSLQILGYQSGNEKIRLKDINQDSKLDLLVLDHEVRVFLGQGSGSFELQVQRYGNQNVNEFVVADLNNDTHLDLIMSELEYDSPGNQLRGRIVAHFGDGTGSFGARAEIIAVDQIESFDVADINQDGKADLLLAHANEDYNALTISIRLGTTMGEFLPATVVKTFTGYVSHANVELSDLNNDGNLDLIVVINSDLEILRGNLGSFQDWASFSLSSGFGTNTVVEDLNQDGRKDILVGDGVFLRLFEQNGSEQFSPRDLLTEDNFMISLAAGEINGDSYLDLLVMERSYRSTGGGCPQYNDVIEEGGCTVPADQTYGRSLLLLMLLVFIRFRFRKPVRVFP